MGILKAFSSSVSGTFADQWRDIISVEPFDETEVIKLGVRMEQNNGRGSNIHASEGVITNGSKIYVPENTFAVIFDGSGIEGIITEPGSFEYHSGEKSILSKDGVWASIIDAIDTRFDFGGQPSAYKQILFMNLREIRNIKFGTSGPVLYHDLFYDTDLEIVAHGTYSIQIVKPATFIQNYLPPNSNYYNFADKESTQIIQAEVVQSLSKALNKLSKTYRTSDLPAFQDEIANSINEDKLNVGSWEERYGFRLSSIYIKNIQFSEDSRELVKQYSSNKMSVAAYDNVSKRSADIAFMQNLSKGIQENGLGDGAGVMLGMNMLQGVIPNSKISYDEQIETIKKLKELVDIGALTQDEFEIKKKEIMGLWGEANEQKGAWRWRNFTI